MDLKINTFNNKSIAYKGYHVRKDDGTSYYKTNSAFKIGATLAAIDAAAILFFTKAKFPKNFFRMLFPVATHLTSAGIIDYKRNKEAAKIAKQIQQEGLNNTLISNDRVMLSRNQKGYYDSNTGAKYGPWLGFAVGLLDLIIGKNYYKKQPKATIPATLLVSTLGGYLLGYLSDSMANKDAQKHA